MGINSHVEKVAFVLWPGVEFDRSGPKIVSVVRETGNGDVEKKRLLRDRSAINVNDRSQKRKVVVFIAISSHPRRLSRRTAIRKTWMPECKTHPKSQCNFFMDKLDRFGKPVEDSFLNGMRSESAENDNDIIFLDTFGGNNMGYRMAKIMQYVMTNYEIDFFLRLDDDHFLCYDRLIKELPHRKVDNRQLYWGYYWQCNEVGKKLEVTI